MTARQPLPNLESLVSRQWDEDIVPQLVEYVRIPAKSPHFDPQWREHGHIDAAVRQAHEWVKRQAVRGMTLEVIRLEGRTPVLFFDIPASGSAASSKSVVLYGHLDTQPEMTGSRGHRAAALPGPHRDLRGERQLRPSRVPGSPGAEDGRRGPRDRARLRRRQLRPALGDDVAARARERNTARRHPHRGRAFR